ncbi:hypothetical protein D3C80_1159310 [compost metagenome]
MPVVSGPRPTPSRVERMVCMAMAVPRRSGATRWVTRVKDGATHHTEKKQATAQQSMAVGKATLPNWARVEVGQSR